MFSYERSKFGSIRARCFLQIRDTGCTAAVFFPLCVLSLQFAHCVRDGKHRIRAIRPLAEVRHVDSIVGDVAERCVMRCARLSCEICRRVRACLACRLGNCIVFAEGSDPTQTNQVEPGWPTGE